MRRCGSNSNPAIYLGETAFAKKHGIDPSTFAPEEWLFKTVDGSLIVTGSKLNGTLFGVYDISQNDTQEWGFICKCTECVKITEREGSESGLILTYTTTWRGRSPKSIRKSKSAPSLT